MNEIISKWTVNYNNHNLAITEDRKVYDMNTLEQLIPYWSELPTHSKADGLGFMGQSFF